MAQDSIPGAAPATATLLAAYLHARYRVCLADGTWLALAIGRHAPPALARSLPSSAFTLVTAWNPQSVMWTRAANDDADAALSSELDALGLPALRAVASDGGGSAQAWSEPGCLVAGLETAGADALAVRYGQAGILHWQTGEPVRLRMYRPRPDMEATPHVDWRPL